MKLARRVSVALALTAACAAVYACVGDDPVGNSPAPDGGSPSTTDSGGTNPGDGGGQPDANGAACDGGGITCDGLCVDQTSDAKNCGRCAHDCGTGKCTSGVCQASLIVEATDGGSPITSITTDQTDDNPKGLATHVFWSVTGAGGGVFQDNVAGGNKLTLSISGAAQRTNVVVDQSDVYWFSQNFGAPPQPVLKGKVNQAGSQAGVGAINGPFIQSILFNPANKNVVGSYATSNTEHGAFKCPLDGGGCVNMTTYSGQPGGNVATDGTNIFFCDPDGGLILRSTLGGNSSGTYMQGQETPNLLRVDGNSIYWSNSGTKTIQRGPLSGSTRKQMAATTNAADGLAADAVNVYWTDSIKGTLEYAPITGAGPNTPYVTMGASNTPMRLVRDAGFLYFTHQGSIYRIALP